MSIYIFMAYILKSVSGSVLVFLEVLSSKYENVNLEAFKEEKQPTLYHWVDR